MKYGKLKFACKTVEHAFEPDVPAKYLLHLRAPDSKIPGILNCNSEQMIPSVTWFLVPETVA